MDREQFAFFQTIANDDDDDDDDDNDDDDNDDQFLSVDCERVMFE